MIPKTLSATSLSVASLCMARWRAEYFHKAPGMGGRAADIGSACHGALEYFIRMVLVEKKAPWEWALLRDLYQVAYVEVFGSADTDTDEYKEGLGILEKWYKRTGDELKDTQVISLENKETFEIPVKHNGEKIKIPFNYIMDRLDQLGETEFRVVDYKSVRVPIQPDELHNKIQARAYALAVQIKYPEATKIRVVFDLLRYDAVGTVFTREDNAATWYYLKKEAQRIADTAEEDAQETLNMDCAYCVRKTECKTLLRNVDLGGIHSLSDDQQVQLAMQVEGQAKALKKIQEELEELILKQAVNRDELEWSTPYGGVEIKMSRRRSVNAHNVARIVGPEIFAQMGNITIGNLEKLIADQSLPQEVRDQLKAEIFYNTGDPKPKFKAKKLLEP